MRFVGRLVLAALLMLLACSGGWATEPSEMWNTYSVDFPLLKDRSVYWETLFETRFNDDMSHLFHYQFYIGPMWKCSKYLDLGIKYGYIEEEKAGEFELENRMMLYIRPRCRLSDLGVTTWPGKISLTLENRVDFQWRSSMDPCFSWRFRVYPSVSYPVYESEELTITPYLRQAVYFQFADGLSEDIYVSQLRTYAGVSLLIYQHTTISVYYMWHESRSKPDAEWKGCNILGTTIGYRF